MATSRFGVFTLTDGRAPPESTTRTTLASPRLTLVGRALLAADGCRVRRTHGHEPGLLQHPSRRDVLMRGRGPEPSYAVVSGRDPAQVADGRGRDTPSGDTLGDPV